MEPHTIQDLPLADRTIVPWTPTTNYATHRRVLVSPTINTPPAFKGYGGFQFDPWSYYPSACALEDGSIFVVGTHEGIAADMEREVGPNPFGPRASVVSAMRFRIRTPAEGEGIELLPIGG